MNIAEMLKYCPKGTKLYSLVDGEVTLKNISDPDEYPIKVVTYNGDTKYYTKDGLFFTNRPGGECVLFPSKEQRDWNKFRLPVKRGDIMMRIDGKYPFISNGVITEDGGFEYICGITGLSGILQISNFTNLSTIWTNNFYIPASEEAKKALFDKIKEAGYKWNADTLKLELNKKQYQPVKQQFKPFERVLVRNESNEKWSINLFSYYDEEDKYYPYVCLSNHYKECIPYGDYNKHVLGTTINYSNK